VKNIYYSAYSNLENHFAWSHFLCPYEICKARCYVAFRTEEELKTHLDIEHKMKEAGKIRADGLLGFEYNDNENSNNNKKWPGKEKKKE
jgi:hypothetical protein